MMTGRADLHSPPEKHSSAEIPVVLRTYTLKFAQCAMGHHAISTVEVVLLFLSTLYTVYRGGSAFRGGLRSGPTPVKRSRGKKLVHPNCAMTQSKLV